MKWMGKTVSHTEMELADTSSESESNDTSTFTEEPGPSYRSHYTIKTGSKVFIPPDILKRPRIVALATRMNLSASKQSAFTKALVQESGGEPSKLAISYATTDRSKRNITRGIATLGNQIWTAPATATLHWDTKQMETLTNPNKYEERLVIAVGTQKETKLLGVPSIKSGITGKAGEIIANETIKLLDKWNCKDSIKKHVFWHNCI